MVFLRPVIVRSKEDSNAIALGRYDYMRSSGIDALPRDTSVMVQELGAPVLPPLTNGQPPPNGTFATVPPKPLVVPAPARAGAVQPRAQAATTLSDGKPEPTTKLPRPVQK